MKMATSVRRTSLMLAFVAVISLSRISEAHGSKLKLIQNRRSVVPRRKPPWGSDGSENTGNDGEASAMKTEWRRKMEEINREEREKWKKYEPTKETGDKIAEGTSKASEGRIIEELQDLGTNRFDERDGRVVTLDRTEVKKSSKLSKSPDSGLEIISRRNSSSEKVPSRKRLPAGIENGRWGMSAPRSSSREKLEDISKNIRGEVEGCNSSRNASQSDANTTTTTSGFEKGSRMLSSSRNDDLEITKSDPTKNQDEKMTKDSRFPEKLSKLSVMRAIVYREDLQRGRGDADPVKLVTDDVDWTRYVNFFAKVFNSSDENLRQGATKIEPNSGARWNVAKINVETYGPLSDD